MSRATQFVLGLAGEERLRHLCKREDAHLGTAAAIVRQVYREFEDEDALRTIDGVQHNRVSRGRYLARWWKAENWTPGLEQAVWRFLVGD